MVLFGAAAIAASTGTIDPNNTGAYKAAFLDNSVVTDPSINFGKFTTESQYNITVSDTELRGYAWGSSVGYMVMNCADTTSGCSSTNGNFKIANDGTGLLSGYAWGDNTGWINFGPFTDTSVSTVKIDSTTGNFEGTSGSAGYAWSQNYGWIVFDCTNSNTCVNTNWRPETTSTAPTGGVTSGGGSPSGPSTPSNPVMECRYIGSGPHANAFYWIVQPNGSLQFTGIPCSTSSSTPPTTTPSGPSTSNPPQSNPSNPTTPPSGASNPVNTSGGGGTSTTSPIVGPTQPPPTNGAQPSGNPTASNPELFANGISLPPALTESLGNILNSIFTPISLAVTGILNAARTPAGTTTNKVASAIGLLATIAAAFATLLFAAPFALAEIALLPFRLWTALLIIFGFKKRAHPWGTVYDSVTKQPIDPAYVILMDMAGNEVATCITDIDGRYGFSVPAGTYKIVANKTNFVFPSVKLANRQSDELYSGLYFGETIVLKEENEIVARNIPMDQLNFDWNEFAKNEQKRLSYYRKSDVLIARFATFFFWLGFAIAAISLLASHTTYNAIVFVIYILLFLIRQYSVQFKPKGAIKDIMTDQPLSFAILHVLSLSTGQEITHKVADRLGNYYCLLPNGEYRIVIDRKNPDASYTKIPVSEPVIVKKGYLKKNFAL